MTLAEQLAAGIAELGQSLSDEVQRKLLDYIGLLDKWNKVYSLTAIREPERMVSLHLLDCLAAIPHLHAPRVLDVGSGGGMPGIPLAIVDPAVEVTMLDSNQKKTSFLRQALIDLDLPRARVITDRVEAVHDEQGFGLITSRAFSDLAEFVRLTRHLLAGGGRWVAMKGVHPYEEIAQLPKDVIVKQVIPLRVPGLDAERHLIVMEVG
ncbi:16S rRNA (guanine(527)-N(7))-methyltransferase RsmG [Chitinivorax sp. PXF-14]|uniref:16S rRNA (guanine(527)-N(7))-methyltransferase RsmG n=1 Tax=Chitinivorax sp. PXF-14 TaxID=3230488 RepID=UPI003467DDE7